MLLHTDITGLVTLCGVGYHASLHLISEGDVQSTSTIPSTTEMHTGCTVPYKAETFAHILSSPQSQRVMCYPHPLYPPPLRRITGVLSPMRQRHSPHTSPRSGLSPSRQRHLTSTMETPGPYHTVVKRLSPLYGSDEPFSPCNLSPHRAPSVTGIPPM